MAAAVDLEAAPSSLHAPKNHHNGLRIDEYQIWNVFSSHYSFKPKYLTSNRLFKTAIALFHSYVHMQASHNNPSQLLTMAHRVVHKEPQRVPRV